jgi:hypothetical protein
MKFHQSIIVGLTMLSLVGLLNLMGGSEVLSATLEEKLASTPTADEHLTAARWFQDKAQAFTAEAVEFETAVSKIGRYDDTKGFRRAALTMGAQENRHDAQEMQELYATHLAQAQTLHGKISPR